MKAETIEYWENHRRLEALKQDLEDAKVNKNKRRNMRNKLKGGK